MNAEQEALCDAAEEHGLIGSTEYVEQRSHFMGQWAVAYINLDMAAMGPDFGAMASPSIRTVIAEAARDVPQAGDPSRSVYDAWIENAPGGLLPGDPAFGDVGGGSDHLPFWGKGGMAVCGLGESPWVAVSGGPIKVSAAAGTGLTL